MNVFAKLKELNILLVDDDDLIRDAMCLFFESEGCRLMALETAEEAIDMIKDHSFDIIIADFKLPGIDGIELFRRILISHRCPVMILITAYMSEHIVKAAKKLGIHDLIEKPFRPETIEESLSKLLYQITSKEVYHAS